MRDVEIPKWLQGLPFAPEFRPTDTEFADPIAYISKIEKEASVFGICKIIPPFPKPSKKFVLANLNKSLLKCPELGDDVGSLSNGVKVNKRESRAVFTTRQQELGLRGKKGKGGSGAQPQLPAAHKQVWQSGEIYTLEQFESKSKTFAKSQLSIVKDASPLVIETLFWKASYEKPIYIEYANDVPGSGFGEPEEASRCFRRSRRSRKRGTFIRNSQECSDFNKDQVNKKSDRDETKDETILEINKITLDSSVEMSKASTSSSSMISDQMSLLTGKKISDAGNEMEGTSGWKLSNSPWNLQVIARSPGSLTRFMPDDIPGVTSPMIYIGMLFSWFAWHVEDHELHSLNFLHTGSQKTWYSIPGDYAFTFEEVIRTQAYGGNIDRLAALTLLGEKTTLLSPEVVVASGIPCCRLVQNPGEFVVTFPRAYHIGFSHGFNCGEAANFGTPKWLTIAKEAAVRRAAMNHLPMLSHQHLLYLLTMSFISRVPRSLLPGVRSSRLKDRQKDERELSVKKAFVEDILNENKLLTTLLKNSSSYHAVLWDLEALASSEKESNLLGRSYADINPSPTKDIHFENDLMKDSSREMNLYTELMDDPYVGDDDMSSDFQVDSGTLPCVACGVLGFPFMTVFQPYETAFLDTVTTNDHIVQDHKNETSLTNESRQTTLKDSLDSTEVKHIEGLNSSSQYLRPRLFCLEHARQTKELLHSKGGAKVLVICHSDFQKVKAHAAAIAEQIGSSFTYNEIPLEKAGQDDLKLINLAIGEEDQCKCEEDWTTKLNINLQQCVKLGNKSSSEKVQHALTLNGLFADANSCADLSTLDWKARKTRSRRKVNKIDCQKSSNSNAVHKDEVLAGKSDAHVAKKGSCLIQYSRKCFHKSKLHGSVSEGISSSELGLLEKSVLQQEQGLPTPGDGISLFTHPPTVENVEEQTSGGALMEMGAESEKSEKSSVDEADVGCFDEKMEERNVDCINENEHEMGKSDGSTGNEPIPSNVTSEECSLQDKRELDQASSEAQPKSRSRKRSKRKREVDLQMEDQFGIDGFIRSPCEGLRSRGRKNPTPEEKKPAKKMKEPETDNSLAGKKKSVRNESDKRNTEGFKAALKQNKCPYKGCGKKFQSYKYTMIHLRVHEDERPLKCSWKGCKMTFKWAWARTEHLRVHTGEKPYTCKVDGCGLSFRFVSDYSRHRRKTGHYVEGST